MKASGFRLDLNELKRKIEKLGGELRPEAFWPILDNYARISLNTASKTTKIRDSARIRTAQKKQYSNRVNYIPSVHRLEDPSLIVKKDGSMWLYAGGKWYRPDQWKLPDELWGAFSGLLAERERRLETSQSEFISGRVQARYLWRKSWIEAGESIGLKMSAPDSVRKSLTRRKPAKNPPKGYAQRRGGKKVISIVIYNPFGESESAYKEFDPVQVLSDALAKHYPAYRAQLQRQLSRVLYAVMHS